MEHFGKAWGFLPGVNIGRECYGNVRGGLNGVSADSFSLRAGSRGFRDKDVERKHVVRSGRYFKNKIIALVIPKSAWRKGAVAFNEWSIDFVFSF